MKRIIDGKRYDTDQATLVASDSYSNPSDFHHWIEELYRTEKGSWFMYGCGGPMSKYSQQTEQNQWSGSERLTPMTDEQAIKWLEKTGHADEIEEYFPDQIEDA